MCDLSSTHPSFSPSIHVPNLNCVAEGSQTYLSTTHNGHRIMLLAGLVLLDNWLFQTVFFFFFLNRPCRPLCPIHEEDMTT